MVLPFWLSLRKQPFWVVHAGRPYALRYTARSASAVGSSLASTIATVLPAPPVVGNRYADTRSVRARPFGAALVADGTRRAKHRAKPSRAVGQTAVVPAGDAGGVAAFGNGKPSGALTRAAWCTVSSTLAPAGTDSSVDAPTAAGMLSSSAGAASAPTSVWRPTCTS